MNRKELEAAATEPRYLVYVEAPGQITTRVTCWRDSEHDTREQAYTRLQAMLPSHPGRLVWIETGTRYRSLSTSAATWRCRNRESPCDRSWRRCSGWAT